MYREIFKLLHFFDITQNLFLFIFYRTHLTIFNKNLLFSTQFISFIFRENVCIFMKRFCYAYVSMRKATILVNNEISRTYKAPSRDNSKIMLYVCRVFAL